MRRRLFTVASVVSLLLCVATAVLWVRSYRVSDQMVVQRTRYAYSESTTKDWGEPMWIGRIIEDSIRISRGIVDVYHKRSVDNLNFTLTAVNVKEWSDDFYPPGIHVQWHHADPLPADALTFNGGFDVIDGGVSINRFGFFLGRYQIKGISEFPQFNVDEVSVPAWLLMLVTAILPLVYTRHRLRRKWRLAREGCPSCGYNLTGNTSGTCPECGTAIPRGPEADS